MKQYDIYMTLRPWYCKKFLHLKITQNKSLLYSFNILFNKTFLLHKCKKKHPIGQNVLNGQNKANITLLEG